MNATELSLDAIIDLLSHIEIFKELSITQKQELATKFIHMNIGGGETLIQQGDEADSLFILAHGRLRVLSEKNNLENIHGEVNPGEIIGEIALLAQQPRTATVKAIRDSSVLKLMKNDFDAFFLSHPKAVLKMAQISIQRLIAQPQNTKKISTITIAPASSNPFFATFSANFIKKLSLHYSVLHLNAEFIDRIHGIGTAQFKVDGTKQHEMMTWLQEQEEKYRFIIYETDLTLTNWTQYCLRQADQLFWIAESGASPALNDIEQYYQEKLQQNHASSSLVLLHRETQFAKICGTAAWLNPRKIDRHLHLQKDSEPDLAKLIRSVNGSAIGLVLSGGGSAGIAHVGVLKAFAELRIPIDWIAGTSMGAIIAAGHAIGLDSEGLLKKVEYFHKTLKKSFDYTFPFTALFSGKTINQLLKETFGIPENIEDLWINFLCISTDIHKGNIIVHERHCLWQAIRASMSLPGIFSPVIDESNAILVDGSLLNNMPVDELHQRMHSGKITSVSLLPLVKDRHFTQNDGYLSGWSLLMEKYIKRNQQRALPNIGEVIASSMLLRSRDHQNQMEKLADISLRFSPAVKGLLDFNSLESVLELGYQVAIKDPKLIALSQSKDLCQ